MGSVGVLQTYVAAVGAGLLVEEGKSQASCGWSLLVAFCVSVAVVVR